MRSNMNGQYMLAIVTMLSSFNIAAAEQNLPLETTMQLERKTLQYLDGDLPIEEEKPFGDMVRHLNELDSEIVPRGVTECEPYSSDTTDITTHLLTSPAAFCMNFGKCKDDYTEHLDDPCICPKGYVGPHCEFNEVDDDIPDCTLDCQHGGECVAGAKTWHQVLSARYWNDPSDKQYCTCPPGKFGKNCEMEGIPCGSKRNHCFHGGLCVEVQDEDGNLSQHCDCTMAGNPQFPGMAYAGEFCEFQATSFCTPLPDHNGRQFCVNGGQCREESHLGCDCKEGFVGPICEFIESNLEPVPCHMTCENGGICRRGAKDMSMVLKYGFGRHLQEASYDDNFEHCVCPKGFAGLQCEYELDVCPVGDHACMHGGECQIDLHHGQIETKCDCSKAARGLSRFVGNSCEMESSEFCTLTGLPPDTEKGSDNFCTNGGKCLAYVVDELDHPGCACPYGYIGPHCEYVMEEEEGYNQRFLMFSLAMILVLGLSIALLFYLYWQKRRNSIDGDGLYVYDYNSESYGINPREMDVDSQSFLPSCNGMAMTDSVEKWMKSDGNNSDADADEGYSSQEEYNGTIAGDTIISSDKSVTVVDDHGDNKHESNYAQLQIDHLYPQPSVSTMGHDDDDDCSDEDRVRFGGEIPFIGEAKNTTSSWSTGGDSDYGEDAKSPLDTASLGSDNGYVFRDDDDDEDDEDHFSGSAMVVV